MAKARPDACGKAVDEILKEVREAGTYKRERIITTAQGRLIGVGSSASPVLNFCANNYLGLCNHPELIAGAKQYLDSHGFGMSSVRFICGTQDIHKGLEDMISKFHGTEDTILFSSCFDANAGFFEAFLTEKDAIISDQLNHASIIDGVRLCKAQRFRYNHRDMGHLEQLLKEAIEKSCRVITVCTDGVFSMDGTIAPLKQICDLCEKYGAILMVDESHAAGFLGPTGRGACEYCGVQSRVDIINSTLGKALGGASGGYSTGRRDIIELLRQRCRPYLFSNTLPPPLVGAYLRVFSVLSSSTDLKQKLDANTALFRKRMKEAGFTVRGDDAAAIAPVMLGDARLATEVADAMLQQGIYVIGFSYPVVPKGEARIRVQLSAAHTLEDVNKCVDAFIAIGREKGLIK
jgi:glycine C-acetyltransferase